MFANIVAVLAVASVVVATPANFARGSGCSTGPTNCCDSFANSGSANSADGKGIIPIALQSLNIPIGVNCLPISVIGAGTAGSCASQAACCSGVDSSGAIPIGLNCNPFAAPL